MTSKGLSEALKAMKYQVKEQEAPKISTTMYHACKTNELFYKLTAAPIKSNA